MKLLLLLSVIDFERVGERGLDLERFLLSSFSRFFGDLERERESRRRLSSLRVRLSSPRTRERDRESRDPRLSILRLSLSLSLSRCRDRDRESRRRRENFFVRPRTGGVLGRRSIDIEGERSGLAYLVDLFV